MSAKPLSKRQKSVLAQAARQAWEALPPETRHQATLQAAHDTNDPLISDHQTFQHWRRSQQLRATGADSLRVMNQRDYLPCLLHFQTLTTTRAANHHDAPLSTAAFLTLAKLSGDERRRARWKLDQALREADLPAEYAATICRTQYKCSLDQATTKQLWQLFYTVRNRRQSTATTTADS